jgi:hypothetical protein
MFPRSAGAVVCPYPPVPGHFAEPSRPAAVKRAPKDVEAAKASPTSAQTPASAPTPAASESNHGSTPMAQQPLASAMQQLYTLSSQQQQVFMQQYLAQHQSRPRPSLQLPSLSSPIRPSMTPQGAFGGPFPQVPSSPAGMQKPPATPQLPKPSALDELASIALGTAPQGNVSAGLTPRPTAAPPTPSSQPQAAPTEVGL